jgi:hypothetical protein
MEDIEGSSLVRTFAIILLEDCSTSCRWSVWAGSLVYLTLFAAYGELSTDTEQNCSNTRHEHKRTKERIPLQNG